MAEKVRPQISIPAKTKTKDGYVKWIVNAGVRPDQVAELRTFIRDVNEVLPDAYNALWNLVKLWQKKRGLDYGEVDRAYGASVDFTHDEFVISLHSDGLVSLNSEDGSLLGWVHTDHIERCSRRVQKDFNKPQ